jgi:hypothetical protein
MTLTRVIIIADEIATNVLDGEAAESTRQPKGLARRRELNIIDTESEAVDKTAQ